MIYNMEAKVTCFSIISSDFYEYNLRPTFLTLKYHFLSYQRYLYIKQL